ncbi:MAG: LLM class flavin-dependent oxidoreductase [Nocardioides sp.]|uniref:LLM class flavin-dependent oxidoreductase n=1 Tax=Nocardioides sp. TaxID=35761 RepID=UPI0039E447EF
MTQLIPAPTTEPPARTRPLRLGFNTRVSFSSGPGGAARGLREGIELFRVAERLGYQSGWCYQRHFDNYLSAPFPFFAAVAQHTERITLGSAVIAMRYQDPILLAENAATADLLADGRVQIAMSHGRGQFDGVFGGVLGDDRSEGRRRLTRFLDAVEGRTLDTVTDPADGFVPGTELRVTPHSETLRSRLWYGAGHIASAVEAAQQGLRLITGTILHDVTDETFSDYQARLIAEYRGAWTGPTAAPPVAVAASVLPGPTPELRELYRAYDLERRTKGPAASKPRGALEQTFTTDRLPPGLLVSPVFQGDPDQVAASVLADPGLRAADELVLFLPPGFGLAQNIRLLTDMARHVAPALGWTPGG